MPRAIVGYVRVPPRCPCTTLFEHTILQRNGAAQGAEWAAGFVAFVKW
jgi:hypothetical protein